MSKQTWIRMLGIIGLLVPAIAIGEPVKTESSPRGLAPTAALRITGVTFDKHIYQTAVSGDNWCQTWAANGNLYTSMDDGRGWAPKGTGPFYNNRVFQIQGGPEPITSVYLDGYPDFLRHGPWYGYGILSVEGTLYHFITRTDAKTWRPIFRGAKLIYSEDSGKNWLRHDGGTAGPQEDRPGNMFFYKETDNWAFSIIAFLQMGQDYSLAKDNYVYLYSPNGRYRNYELNMARVPKDKILDRSAYEFFVSRSNDGDAKWTSDLTERGVVRKFYEGYGQYSWFPSVVYNSGLNCYIMVASGMGECFPYKKPRWCNNPAAEPATLGVYQADKPWGPWKEVFYTKQWTAGDSVNRLYQPKLSPKFISEDGKEMFLIFSGCRDRWTTNYKWNQQKLTFAVSHHFRAKSENGGIPQ